MAATAQALDSSSLRVEWKPLSTPPLPDVAKVLEDGLQQNFSEASVEVVECPDLSQKPWGLAAKGLCGSPRLLDIGGVPYLMPSVQRDKLYEMRDYPKLTDIDHGLIIGAGAAPWPYLDRNAEMMPNLFVNKDGTVVQETRIARTFDHDGSYGLEKLPPSETRNSILGNLYLSEGSTGPVLKVTAKMRTGQKNFVTCMREALMAGFPGLSVGMGGVFLLAAGKAKVHVMPDFSPCPINTDEEVSNWLKFYEMSAPFTVLSFLVANDPGLALRVEHSHGWGEGGQGGGGQGGHYHCGEGGQGGHYHCDTTPEEVEYVGYFNLAEKCYRVDRPRNSHMGGKDWQRN